MRNMKEQGKIKRARKTRKGKEKEKKGCGMQKGEEKAKKGGGRERGKRNEKHLASALRVDDVPEPVGGQDEEIIPLR